MIEEKIIFLNKKVYYWLCSLSTEGKYRGKEEYLHI